MRMVAMLAALLAACAGNRDLVTGQSTLAEVEAVMGRAAEARPGTSGETVYYFPRLPYGRETYAARIGPDGRLLAIEQRLTEANIAKVVPGQTSGNEVRNLLGPPFEPMKVPRMQRDIWTYPMRVAGYPAPKWFVVQVSTTDGIVRETYLMDDPAYVQRDSLRR